MLQEAQVIHISGTLTWPEVEVNAANLSSEQRRWYRPYPYLHDNMGAAFRAADLVVARAGASMLGEGPAFGLPVMKSFYCQFALCSENFSPPSLTSFFNLGQNLLMTLLLSS